MELNSVSLGVFTQLANVMFEKAKDTVPQHARKSGLFKETAIPMNTGDSRRYTEIDLEEFASKKAQGDQSSRARVQQGYEKDCLPYRVAKDIGITYEMRTRNKYPEVMTRLTNLGVLFGKRLELDLTHRITFGQATTYTDQDGDITDISCGDTLSLLNAAHTLRGSSTTFRNILAVPVQVSEGGIEGLENLVVTQTFNQFGQKKTLPFDILFTSDDPNTVNAARRFMQSTAQVSAPNSGVKNVYEGKYRHVILPYLATDASGTPDATKAKWYGIASSIGSTAHLDIWEEGRLKAPAPGNNGEDFSTDDWNYGVRGGYGIAVVSGDWIKMALPANS